MYFIPTIRATSTANRTTVQSDHQLKPEHCLHYLLPTAREQSVTDRLQSVNKLPRISAKTNRFKNLLFFKQFTV